MRNYLERLYGNILSPPSRKTLPFLQCRLFSQSRQISPVKSDFVSERLFHCPLICAKKWCLGLGVKVRGFSLLHVGWDRVGSLGKEVWELPVWPCVLWYLCTGTPQSQRMLLLLFPPLSGPLAILPQSWLLAVEKQTCPAQADVKEGHDTQTPWSTDKANINFVHVLYVEREEISSLLISWKGDDRTWRGKKTRQKARRRAVE